jgi:AcrR family transcriptional regulator
MVKREDQKALLKGKILSAAREVFTEEGFESATIGKIAQRAGVGLGTAYNYFESKEDLFILAMADELVGTAANDPQSDVSSGGSPWEIVSAMVLGNIRRLNFFGKKIWRVTLSSIFKSMKSDHPVIRELIRADYRFMGNIAAKLEDLKKADRLTESFSTETAVNLIYGAVMFNLMSYVYEEDRTFDEACHRLEESIRLVVGEKV